jgi:hypothetical protein
MLMSYTLVKLSFSEKLPKEVVLSYLPFCFNISNVKSKWKITPNFFFLTLDGIEDPKFYYKIMGVALRTD